MFERLFSQNVSPCILLFQTLICFHSLFEFLKIATIIDAADLQFKIDLDSN